MVAAGSLFKDALAERWYLWKLSSNNESERIAAAEVLGRLGSPKAVPRLIELNRKVWDSGDPDDHYTAQALAAIGRPALPSLIACLDSGDPTLRIAAISLLPLIKGGELEAVPPLCRALEDVDTRVSGFAASALGALGPLAKEALPHLLRAAGSGPSNRRHSSILALGGLGVSSPEVIDGLTSYLDDPDSWIRYFAASSMVSLDIGQLPSHAVPAFLNALGDKQLSFSEPEQATRLLRKIGLDAVPVLTRALEDTTPLTRRSVVMVLEAIQADRAARADD